jgi:hypothetical protein
VLLPAAEVSTGDPHSAAGGSWRKHFSKINVIDQFAFRIGIALRAAHGAALQLYVCGAPSKTPTNLFIKKTCYLSPFSNVYLVKGLSTETNRGTIHEITAGAAGRQVSEKPVCRRV